ncbi:glutathione peroxidase [Mariprofundus erugo]|uniref:glutathione peroxidase n=1 Tax=Mariprofundus erugo TaxID=2528639 RepID=UPI0010FEFC49|nr:glutathione peroxidase [Mariprofundus erugo]TLS73973.1 glutathione peroxidase [Mariprofundus erugo]
MRRVTWKMMWLMGLLFPTVLAAAEDCPPLLDYSVHTLVDHRPVRLCDAFRGRVLLVVNTASKCAFTPQYESLEKLYATYRPGGLVVLGFPSNDFGQQEPGSEQDIHQFCRMTYDVQFPMFAKTTVRGSDADPLYKALAAAAGESPAWNFHKYLIGRDGKLIASFASAVAPFDRRLIQAVEKALAAGAR